MNAYRGRSISGVGLSILLAGGLLVVPGLPVYADDSTEQETAQESQAPSEAPTPVVDALKAHFPGAQIEKWSQETEDSVVIYDFEFTQKGHKLEADLRADGSIHNWEESMAAKDVPDTVRAVVEAKYPKATWQEVMRINTVHDGKDVLEGYEVVLVSADSSAVEITVAPNGKVLEDKSRGE